MVSTDTKWKNRHIFNFFTPPHLNVKNITSFRSCHEISVMTFVRWHLCYSVVKWWDFCFPRHEYRAASCNFSSLQMPRTTKHSYRQANRLLLKGGRGNPPPPKKNHPLPVDPPPLRYWKNVIFFASAPTCFYVKCPKISTKNFHRRHPPPGGGGCRREQKPASKPEL